VLAILERMIAKKPEERFGTPEQVGDALRPFAVSGPTPWALPTASSQLAESDPNLPAASALLPTLDSENPVSSDDANEDLEALSLTMSGDLLETPSPESPSRLYRRTQHSDANNRLTLAVLTAVSLIAGLIVVVILAAFLFGPK
jgi:hypothetical protein